MSVAFRRESDDEHLEPKFELPIPPGPNLVTTRGLDLIEAALAEWQAAVASAIDEDSRKAASRDLRYWSTRLATARVVAPPSDGTIGIGTRVTLRRSGVHQVISIVGHDEAEPGKARLAFAAPFARILIGACAGDRLDFQGVPDAIEIVAVEPRGQIVARSSA